MKTILTIIGLFLSVSAQASDLTGMWNLTKNTCPAVVHLFNPAQAFYDYEALNGADVYVFVGPESATAMQVLTSKGETFKLCVSPVGAYPGVDCDMECKGLVRDGDTMTGICSHSGETCQMVYISE